MREIKFRAWDKEQKKMLNWELLQWNQVGFVHSLIGEGNWRAMQYTGLLDKNGKEIYEGDIVRISDDLIEVMEWVGDGDWMGEKQPLVGFVHHQSIYKKPIEVIGNIYENPELVKT